MNSSKVVHGEFSKIAGSNVRLMYDADGHFIGTITKGVDGGYRIMRAKDGKVRHKPYLADAYKSISRAN